MSAHALLSASSAHKWLSCTPSARLEEQIPESASEYAEEGRLAHEIAELKLTKYITPMSQRAYNSRLKKLQENPLYQAEMLTHTDIYMDYIAKTAHSFSSTPYMAAEKKLDFSGYVPEGYGTSDCVMIGDNTLHVIDFKYGKGVPVSAECNPQMMLYALGAYAAYSFLYSIIKVKLSIIQPRLDSISEYEMSTNDLLEWGESIKPIAQKAFAGEGEYNPGEWCRFCRAKAQCRARADAMTALEAFGGAKPPLISNEEIGEILNRARTLKDWVTDLEEYALSALLSGEEIPGWKAVEGRSVRQFDDTEKAFETLKAAGYDEALLYERKPITLTAVEKLLGKAKFEELLKPHIIKPPGKPALAPETDKREAITNKITAAEAFAVNNN